MTLADKVVSWLVIALGLIHLSLTEKVHPHLGIDAIWFASGGLLIMSIGALNLLRVAYGSVARGVRAVSVVGNLVLLLLMVVFAILLPLRGNPQTVVGLVLAALVTVFSLFRRVPQVQTRPAEAGK